MNILFINFNVLPFKQFRYLSGQLPQDLNMLCILRIDLFLITILQTRITCALLLVNIYRDRDFSFVRVHVWNYVTTLKNDTSFSLFQTCIISENASFDVLFIYIIYKYIYIYIIFFIVHTGNSVNLQKL